MPKEKTDAFQKSMEAVWEQIRAEFEAVDPNLEIAIEKQPAPAKAMDAPTTKRFLDGLYALPHGVFAMIRDMPNVTETSTNLAIVKVEKGLATITNMLRSSVDSKRTDVGNTLRSVLEAMGAEVETHGGYPGWQPYTASPVLKMLRELYQRKFGKVAHVTATHGGLLK